MGLLLVSADPSTDQLALLTCGALFPTNRHMKATSGNRPMALCTRFVYMKAPPVAYQAQLVGTARYLAGIRRMLNT